MSKIEWLHMPGYKPQVWNPVTGCSKVSPGCQNCYALPMSRRLSGIAGSKDKYRETTKGNKWTGQVFIHPEELKKPRSWKKPRMVFVNSMADLFHPKVPYHFQADVFETMYRNQSHIYLILTKHAERMNVIVNRICETKFWGKYLPHVWLGVSVENQQYANERIPYLVNTLAAVRFLSCEPLLGPLNLKMVDQNKNFWLPDSEISGTSRHIHWVIAGGESGRNARPMHPDWVSSLRDQCKAAGVPFFFKQWGEWIPNYQRGVFNASDTCKSMSLPCGESFSLAVDLDFYKVGKHLSGNMLDGKQHLEWPTLCKCGALSEINGECENCWNESFTKNMGA